MVKSAPKKKRTNRFAIIFAVILVVALVVRIVWISQITASEMGNALSVDSKFYRNLASEMVAGNSLPAGALTFNPLYPFFLAAVFRLFGEGLLATRIVQSFLGLAMIALILVAGGRLVEGRRKDALSGGAVAALAAAMAVFYPIFILYEGMILGTTIEIFLLAAAFTLALALDEDLRGVEALRVGSKRVPPWLSGGILGALCGAGALGRPNLFLLLVLGIFVWIIARNRTKRGWLAPAFGFAVGAALFLMPPTIYNAVNAGEFVPVTTHGGINFYIGNKPGSIGVYEVPDDMRGAMRGFIEDARAKAERETGRKMTDAESSDYYMEKALARIKQDPGGWIVLLARKLVLFWNKVEIHDMPDVFFFQNSMPLFRLLFLPFSVIAPLGIAGFVVLMRSGRNRSVVCLFLGASLASVLLFYVNSRYRLPIVPVVMLLAALFIVWAAREASRKRLKEPVLLMALAMALFAFVSNRSIVTANEASVYTYLGNAYMNAGDREKAAEAFAKAYRLNPNLDVAIINHARMLLLKSDFAGAAQLFARGYARNPRYPRLAIEYAFALDNLGRRDEARGLYREAYSSGRPDEQVIACKALAQAAFFEGKKDEVLQWVNAGLAIAPEDPDLAAMLQAAQSTQ